MRKPLGCDEIHVWTASLSGQDTPATILDPEERRRAGSFLRPRSRADFVRGRTILRQVLARYLSRDPASLIFTHGPHGKPALADGADLRFNASHSGSCLVIAVRRVQAIGVDVERRRDLPNAGALARRFFTRKEASQIEALAAERRAEGFRALWTLKEAIVKAEGEALAYHLDRIEGALGPDGVARFVAWHGMGATQQAWSVVTFSPAPCYCAALATRPPAAPPLLFGWDGDHP
jgi:4'-phosphopantetheinyl transferase